MTAVPKKAYPREQAIVGLVALCLIVLHFASYGQMYLTLFTTGVSLSRFGEGRLMVANLVIFTSIIAALACLLAVCVRAVRANSKTRFLPSVMLITGGFALPWLGITIAWLLTGGA